MPLTTEIVEWKHVLISQNVRETSKYTFIRKMSLEANNLQVKATNRYI